MGTIKRKVCMIVPDYFVVDSRVIREAKTLTKDSYDVTIFALHKGGLHEKETLHGFTVVRIPLLTLKLPQNIIFLFIKYLEFIVRCYLGARKMDPVVCHCHDVPALPVGYLLVKFGKCKLIYDSHELWGDPKYTPSRTLFFLTRKLEYFVIKKVNKVITTSDSRADFISRQNKIKRPHVIKNLPNSVKIKRSNKIKDVLGLADDNRRIVLYQGWVKRARGLENLVISMQWVNHSIVVMLGDGVLKKELRDLAIQHKIGDKVFFIHAVSPEELLSYTSSADVGISSIQNVCLSYYYSLPNKLFEYLMAGLPVAVSDFPEVAKIVKKYEVGEVFDPDEPRDIARAINSLLNDPARYQRCKANTRKVASVYNWENEEKKLLRIYSKLLE